MPSTFTAQLAALRGELKKHMEEYEEQAASYQTESEAFTQELQDYHNEQNAYHTVLEELRSFQKKHFDVTALTRVSGRR